MHVCSNRPVRRNVAIYAPLYIILLQFDFKDFFHEHESTKIISVYYKVMEYTYTYVKLIIYNLLVVIFGIIFAILYATLNGIMSFVYVWVFGPSLKIILLWVSAVAPFATTPVRVILIPLVNAIARIFRQIRIQVHLSGVPEYIPRERCNV